MKKTLLIIFYTLLLGIIIGTGVYFLFINGKSERPESISLNQNILGLKPEDSYQLSFYIMPNSLNNQIVTYESSDESIVRINKVTGYLETENIGEAIVTVKVDKYPEIKDTCKIIVSKENINVNKVILNQKDINLNIGESYQLKYNIEPSNATIHEIEFISDNEEVAIINAKGIITGKNKGIATIQVLDKISNKFDTVKVNVGINEGEKQEEKKEVLEKVEEINLLTSNITLNVNEKKKIEIELYPKLDKNVEWTSSDNNIVSVDTEGNITGKKSGTATITASVDGLYKSVFVSVIKNEEQQEDDKTKTFIGVFNGKTLSCKTEKDSCTVTSPTIEKNGYEIIGWSRNINSHEKEIDVGSEVTLTKNIEYYPVVRKKLEAKFIVQENSEITSEGNGICYIYNNETSCKVKAPSVKGKDNYIALGWNTNKDAKIAIVNSDETVSIRENVTYYSISIRKAYLTATFKVQDGKAIKESTKEVTCEPGNDGTCEVEVPVYTANSGYTIVGFNSDKSATEKSIGMKEKITISSDMTYYTITKRSNPLVATFVIQNNTAIKSEENTTCELYNGETLCKIKVPILTARDGNIVIGWNSNKDATSKILSGGEIITLNSDVTYYSITRSMTPLTATFNITTPKLVSVNTESVSCDLYNGNKSCYIETPLLIKKLENVTPLGWNTDKSAIKASIGNNYKIAISKNITYHSIVSQVITVTFAIGDSVEGKNIKAEKLSFNYTDKNGNTVIKEEGQSLKTTCISYNGKGCTIGEVPTIYSKGNHVEGYSLTPGGKNIKVFKENFLEDTTIYTRVGYRGTISIQTVNTSYQKMYGNIIFEAENGMSQDVVNKAVNVLDIIYKYYPELLYYDGKYFLFTKNTYMTTLKHNKTINNSAGISLLGHNYNNIYFYYNSRNPSYYLEVIAHELGHAFDYSYYHSFGKAISNMDELIALYDKYKNTSNRPLSNYAYTNHMEFFAEMFCVTLRQLIYEKEGKYLYGFSGSKQIPDDLRNFVIKVINNKRNDLVKKGFIK